mmetsp:Transcript_42642/g.75442  ORF Transcript_42642/g.75442 Transcript_42642/m.75442 type:complete len:265 (+) Transcript_42642:61-855(+)
MIARISGFFVFLAAMALSLAQGFVSSTNQLGTNLGRQTIQPRPVAVEPNVRGTPPPDPIEFVTLLGKLTPNPNVEDEESFDYSQAIQQQGDDAIAPDFVAWLKQKVELNKEMGNSAAVETLSVVLNSIAGAITLKLKPATDLIKSLVEADSDCEKVRLLRAGLVLPGGPAHPYYQEPREGEAPPTVDPMLFKVAHDVVLAQVRAGAGEGPSEELAASEAALAAVLGTAKQVLNGDPIDKEEDCATCEDPNHDHDHNHNHDGQSA